MNGYCSQVDGSEVPGGENGQVKVFFLFLRLGQCYSQLEREGEKKKESEREKKRESERE